MKKIIAIIFTFFLIVLSTYETRADNNRNPLYIFLFIGDGMGINQYLAAQRNTLTKNIDSFPVSGEVTTHSFKNVVTDSAAAATAIATGEKTRNETLGLDSRGNRISNISELALENEIAVGIISTMSLNHATPAGFYAHINSRNAYYEIGLQLIASNIDYFGGGGFYHHNGKDKKSESLYKLAEKFGYAVFMNGEIPDTNNLSGKRNKVISVNPTLRSDACMPYVEKRTKNGRTLADFVKEAIQILSDISSGFLIVVEGGNIDYACHDNEFKRMLHEMEDFDNAVSEALNFYCTHPENTLIIVTGDHETGGLHFVPKDPYSVKWSTKYHTGANVPIFAIGVKNEEFYGASGIIDNTNIAKILFNIIQNGIE
ncbi:MAG: alkaline phosphatase [Synergistaceae bacterium]|nr:alkaline phosphatase [Synergistaceae bacterium]